MKKGQHFGLGVHRFDMSWMLFVKSLKSYVWSLLVLLLYEYRHKHVGARTAVSSPPSPGCVCLTPWWALITVNSAVAGTGTSPPAAQTNSRGWWTTKCGVSTLGFVQRQSGLSFALKLHRQLNYTFSFLSLHYLQVILISVRVICHFSFLSNPVKFFFFLLCCFIQTNNSSISNRIIKSTLLSLSSWLLFFFSSSDDTDGVPQRWGTGCDWGAHHSGDDVPRCRRVLQRARRERLPPGRGLERQR